jgi:hypothetical protein
MAETPSHTIDIGDPEYSWNLQPVEPKQEVLEKPTEEQAENTQSNDK